MPRMGFSELNVRRFDVVKSRIQGTKPVPGVAPKYNWTYPAIMTIAREEGVAALYKGASPTDALL